VPTLEAVRRSPDKAKSPLEGLAHRTARLWRGRVTTYGQAVELGALVRLELEIHRPREWGKKAIARLEPGEVGRLLAAAYRDGGPAGTMCKTLLLGGLRVSELCALEVGDLRLELREIQVRQGKGHKARTVPILGELAHELTAHLGGRKHGPVFYSLRRGRMRAYSERRIQQIVKAVAAAAGITKRVHPHLLRHTIAQHLLDHGMSMDQIQRFLGHTSIATTQVYAGATAGAVRAAYRAALQKGRIDG
jgi:integrase/recombinase XerD